MVMVVCVSDQIQRKVTVFVGQLNFQSYTLNVVTKDYQDIWELLGQDDRKCVKSGRHFSSVHFPLGRLSSEIPLPGLLYSSLIYLLIQPASDNLKRGEASAGEKGRGNKKNWSNRPREQGLRQRGRRKDRVHGGREEGKEGGRGRS